VVENKQKEIYFGFWANFGAKIQTVLGLKIKQRIFTNILLKKKYKYYRHTLRKHSVQKY